MVMGGASAVQVGSADVSQGERGSHNRHEEYSQGLNLCIAGAEWGILAATLGRKDALGYCWGGWWQVSS